MTSYKLETDQFGLSETGLHLLRSRFNYETIEYSSMDQITIDRGRQVANWLIVLIVGLVLFCLGGYILIKVIYEYFFADNYHLFYVEQFILPVIPLMLGAFSIYHSLKSGPVLKITINNKTKHYPIGELKKKSQIKELVTFLSNNTLTKNKLTINLADA